MNGMNGNAVAGGALKIAAMAAAAAALLAAGFEIGAKAGKPSPIELLELSGVVINGGPIAAPAKWSM